MEAEYRNLLDLIEKNKIKASQHRLDSAWEFAKIAHYGQKRLTGEDYVMHCLETAIILAEWGLDESSIIAGMLHDTIEDCGIAKEELIEEFGEDVAVLVDGVSKVSQVRLVGSREQEFIENLRKIFLVMARDVRVVLVKLADRLHNMRTLDPLPFEKQKKIARETLEVLSPLAERLGMGEVKGELDDLAFIYAYPDEYKKVLKLSAEHYEEAEEHIKLMKRKLLKELSEQKIKVDIKARKKHLYSLWTKLNRPSIEWDFGKIHDIVALRVLTNSIADCYVVLGVVHSAFKPVPHIGISDFIAQPKPNGYRSIHTKVFGPVRRIVEVQIRTFAMHEEAEHGVAAHWAYADKKQGGVSPEYLEEKGVVVSSKLDWVQQLVKWQDEIKDSEEFMDAVKFDALNHRIFVFSPKGDVFDLPSSATAVDFAFAVHTDLGRYIKGARINGQMVSLDHKLESGDVCEIIKTKNPRLPSRGWLRFVATTAAKRHITRDLE